MDVAFDAPFDLAPEREFDDTHSPSSCPPRTPARVPLADVLAALGERVAPTSMARERTLPIGVEYAGLFADEGLVRGRVLSCTGAAATSVALGVVAAAVAAGSWVAVIDVPTLGLDAACELGVPLDRIVAIDTRSADTATESADEPAGRRWADVVAAAADGFDVMIARVPAEVRPATVRKVATRLQQRGVVMVVLGDPGHLVTDGVLDTVCRGWGGIGAGWGHLGQRSVEVAATGRRLPGRRTVELPSLGDDGAATLVPAPVTPPSEPLLVDVAELSTAS